MQHKAYCVLKSTNWTKCIRIVYAKCNMSKRKLQNNEQKKENAFGKEQILQDLLKY